MSQTGQRLTGSDAYTTALRKARFGRRDWLVWRDRDGGLQAAVASASTLKETMLACGTQGTFTLLCGGSGNGLTMRWRLAVIWLSNYRCRVQEADTRRPDDGI